MTHIHVYRDKVRPEWIDYNGHMNVAFYVLAFDYATEGVLDKIGMGERYCTEEGKSVFVVESHITYQSEVLENEPLEIRSYILGYDLKRIHLYHEMFSAESGQKSATIEIMALHVDMKSRKTTEINEVLLKTLHKLTVTSLEEGRPSGAGRKIKILGKSA
ncbi:thioesterase family protein [Terasakiella pusilla]|uniref:thioesterase family protein n=1 Tax=Terasakiella pusilla TaxID=64973 RepID=UPI00056E320F|nr:thioesterase family protein [Terasakiella pusilla]